MAEASLAPMSKRILVVDDDWLVVSALALMLRKAGYCADVARNGQEALDRVSAGDYDLIICDIRMPVVDGRAFYSQLSNLRPGLSQRVVFCTGDVDNPAIEHFLQVCGAPVIHKPFRLRTVLDVVSSALTQDRCPLPVAP
jgi:CheY-like chemotaxis protein